MFFHKTYRAGLFALFFWILTSLFSNFSIAEDAETQAIKMVQEFGKDLGGRETILSLVTLYMIYKKPRSEDGVNIRGWYSIKLEDATYLVFFSYIEGKLEKWKWQVQMKDKKVSPLDEMAESFWRMAKIF
jgi:hypothetical protein